MGISILGAQMLLHEHRYRPITGNVVTIARHSVDIAPDEMDNLLSSMGIKKRKIIYEIDTDTVSGESDRQCISDKSFFASFIVQYCQKIAPLSRQKKRNL